MFRQQYAQALAQQKAAVLSSAPLQQQQQHQQQINLLLQQYQALKLRLKTPTRTIYITCTHTSVLRSLNLHCFLCSFYFQAEKDYSHTGSVSTSELCPKLTF